MCLLVESLVGPDSSISSKFKLSEISKGALQGTPLDSQHSRYLNKSVLGAPLGSTERFQARRRCYAVSIEEECWS